MKNQEVRLTLIGGPTVLIEMAGTRILTDSTLDPPSEYPSGNIVLKKTVGPAVSADQIGAIDAVLLSHDQHFDNFDHAGRAFLSNAKTTFTTRSGAERLGTSRFTIAVGRISVRRRTILNGLSPSWGSGHRLQRLEQGKPVTLHM